MSIQSMGSLNGCLIQRAFSKNDDNKWKWPSYIMKYNYSGWKI